MTDVVIGLVCERVRPACPAGHGAGWESLVAHEDEIKAWLAKDLKLVKVRRRPVGNAGAGGYFSGTAAPLVSTSTPIRRVSSVAESARTCCPETSPFRGAVPRGRVGFEVILGVYSPLPTNRGDAASIAVIPQLAGANPPAAYEPDLASALNNLSVRLAEAGRGPEAEMARSESVEVQKTSRRGGGATSSFL